MLEDEKEELFRKGWKDQEIEEAEKVLEKEEAHDVFFSKIVFWSALVVIIFANVIVSLVLIPFLIVLKEWLLYVLVFVLAGVVGFLYNFLITDIGHLEKKHHLIAAVIIPILALGNMVVVVLISNGFIIELGINNPEHNPWFLGGVFVVAFALPYFIDQLRKHSKLRNKGEE